MPTPPEPRTGARLDLRRLARRVNLRILHLMARLAPSEERRLFGMTLVIGVLCGLVAVGFHATLQAVETLLIGRALALPLPALIPATLLLPAAGGALAGIVLTRVVPGARGSGIPEVKVAYASGRRRVPFRNAVAKFALSVVQIGTGASLGREGPTVHICASLASAMGRLAAFSERVQVRLIPVGAAAGIAAAFNAPIAAVTFVIEEIVGEIDHSVLSGVVIAAAVAAVTERGILGTHPVIEAPAGLSLGHPGSLVLYALLGLAAALASVVFLRALLGARAWFRSLRTLPAWAHPALGGFLTGVLALAALLVFRQTGVAGGGYGALGDILGGDMAVRVLAGLLILKLAATVTSYSSGGVGGIFMPVLFLGAVLGGLVGHLNLALIPASENQVSAFALVGMGALFAGVVRAPITSVLIIFEMTDGYGLILPLMIANMITYGLVSRWRVKPVYEALLEQDGIRLPGPRRPDMILERIRVGEAMKPEPVTLPPWLTVGDSLDATLGSGQAVYPVVDEGGLYRGLVHDAELRQRAAEGRSAAPVSEFVEVVAPLQAADPLRRAVERLHRERRNVLPVVGEPAGPDRVVGLLSMNDIVRAQGEHLAGSESPRDA